MRVKLTTTAGTSAITPMTALRLSIMKIYISAINQNDSGLIWSKSTYHGNGVRGESTGAKYISTAMVLQNLIQTHEIAKYSSPSWTSITTSGVLDAPLVASLKTVKHMTMKSSDIP